MGSPLSETTLIFIAPRLGVGGVGDYAEEVVRAVRPYFGRVVDYRHGGPGDDSVADLRAHSRAIAEHIAAADGPVIVHAELSGGALVPFWGTARIPAGVPVTATIHDPPHPIWWPARTKFFAQHWLANHLLHFPLRPVSYRVQRKWLRATTLFVLTTSGARSIVPEYPGVEVVEVPHIVSVRPDIEPPENRPLAVGFFGLVYRGKGFELIGRLRDLIPAEIAIRVAGRGTEDLPPVDGVEMVGGVDGADEDAFFGSVRAIVMPYGKRSPYGMGYPASGVMSRAIAYGTPVICTDHGALGDMGRDDGIVVLRDLPEDDEQTLAAEFSSAVQALVADDDVLRAAGLQVQRERQAASADNVARAMCDTWSTLVEVAR